MQRLSHPVEPGRAAAQAGLTPLVPVLSGLGLVIGLLFAVLFPIDPLIAGGNALRSVVLFVMGVWLATILAPKVGLSSGVVPQRSILGAVAGYAVLQALYIVIVDAVLFRSVLPANYVNTFLHEPLAERLLGYCTRAFYESLMYRFFIGTTLIWCIRWVLRLRGPIPFGIVMMAMLAAQTINIAANVLGVYWPEATPAVMLWIVVRFVLPGTFWGYVYYRSGLVVSEYAASALHLILQPVIGFALAAGLSSIS